MPFRRDYIILPFLFVLNPALTMQGDAQQIIFAFLSCALGVIILSSGLEGYLIGIVICVDLETYLFF